MSRGESLTLEMIVPQPVAAVRLNESLGPSTAALWTRQVALQAPPCHGIVEPLVRGLAKRGIETAMRAVNAMKKEPTFESGGEWVRECDD